MTIDEAIKHVRESAEKCRANTNIEPQNSFEAEAKKVAEQSEGIAKKRRARQGQSIEKLCFARAEDFSYKGAGERAEQWGKKKSATWTACTACIRIASTSGR